jgi:hypothetical protein
MNCRDMPNKNIDGIRHKIVRPVIKQNILIKNSAVKYENKPVAFHYASNPLSKLVIVVSLFLGFVFAFVTLSFISSTSANKPVEQAVVSEVNFEETSFNTQLKSMAEFFEERNEPDEIAERSKLIKKYLESKKSPFAEMSDLIARQEHWKMILAISNAESTLGRSCSNNNCSGIGVKPGHASWREYETFRHWVVDFNSLLERKYKNWTLKEMCGVYVQPCNKNWLSATRQILMEIQQLESSQN